jgi:hypothetical protein
VRPVPHLGRQRFFNRARADAVDIGTLIEHKKNITRQEASMTDFIRDMAAFTSVVVFVASCALVMMSI